MLITLTLLSTLLIPGPPAQVAAVAGQADDCGDWEDCRDQALTARNQDDFERFHDLAWRAVQKGPRNDAALLTLLARAQSLSGRPHDALVMLQRLAAMGVVTDAAESEDFRRVRALPGWADLLTRIAGAPTAGTSPDDPAAEAAKPKTSAKPPGTAAVPKTAARKAESAKAAATKAEPTNPTAESEAIKKKDADEAVGVVEDALRFTTIPFEPAGLVYDAVSTRFIMGDRRERKLSVIGERSQRLVNLAGEESAGFGEVEALAVDTREGDLWVASTPDGGTSSKLHKLQLISGRVLLTATVAEEISGARLTDIAVTRDGVVLALDSSGRRLFRLNPGDTELALVSSIELTEAVSIAPSPDGVVYVAGGDGIARIAAGGQEARSVKPSGTINLAGLECIRWHREGLLGVQRSADGLFRIMRIRLDSGGRTATSITLLEKAAAMASPSTIAVTDDALFYLGRDTGYSASGRMDITIRRVKLR